MMLGRNQIRNLINEAIYGKSAIVYHGSRTPPDELIKSYNAGGFQPGKGAGGLYGMGLYTVYDDKDLFVSNTGTGDYGENVYKFKTNLNNFLALNEDTCKLVHGQILTVRQQLEKMQSVKTQIRDIENSNASHLLDASLAKKDTYTGSIAKVLSVYLMNDIVGMLFRGSNDGYVCLIFDDANTFPVAYATVDEIQAAGTIKKVNWKKISKSDIENVVKRSATTTAQPGKFMSNNLRDRDSGAYGMTDLEQSNVDVFLKRYQGLKKHIKINADVIPEEGYLHLKQKVLAGLKSVDNIREDQYKEYAIELMFFEKALSTASTLQGVINVVEFDDVFDGMIIGERFGTELELGNQVGAKIRSIIDSNYKDASIQTLSSILSKLRVTRSFIEKTKALYNAVGTSFNIIGLITNGLLNLVRYKESNVDKFVLANNMIGPLIKMSSKDGVRFLENELRDILNTEAEKAGKEAADQINNGIKPSDAIINAVNNNRLLSVVVRYMRNASKDLNKIIAGFAEYSYDMSGVTQAGEYVMLLVLQEAFKNVDKTNARAAYDSLAYFLNKKLIPTESTYGLTQILQSKLK